MECSGVTEHDAFPAKANYLNASKPIIRVALLGSSLSCGFPFGGPSWWDLLEKQCSEASDKSPYKLEFMAWRGLEFSIRDYRCRLPELLKSSPSIVIIDCSSMELMLRKIQDENGNFPLFDANLDKIQVWPKVDDVQRISREALDDLAKITSQLKSFNIKIVLIGPAACLREIRPLRSMEVNRSLAKQQEIMALADLADKNQTESPQYALRCYERLVTLEPNLALHYWACARQLQRMGRIADANKFDRLAWEKDLLPLRGTPLWGESILKLAKDLNSPCLDLQNMCDQISPQGLAGFDVFFDAVHPREVIHGLIAQKIREVLVGDKTNFAPKNAKLATDTVKLWYNIAKSLYASFQNGIAWEAMHKALELSPHHMPSLKLMLKMAVERNEYNYIKGLCLNILKLNPYDESIWEQYIWSTALEVGPEVGEALSQMPSIYWNSSVARFAQGLLTWKINKMPLLAREDLESGLQMDRDPNYQSIMRMYYSEIGEFIAMIDMMEKEWINEPENMRLGLDLLTRILVESWKHKEVLEGRKALFEDLCQRNPKDMRILLCDLMYCWKQSSFDEALVQAENMLNLSYKFNIPLNREQIKEYIVKLKQKEVLTKDLFLMSLGKTESDFK